MLKKLILKNWKSFRYAELPIDSLTVLIGANASGKSNAIEALKFLKKVVSGDKFDSILANMRGGQERIVLHNGSEFSLAMILQSSNTQQDYTYEIDIEVIDKIKSVLQSESLFDNNRNQYLIKTKEISKINNRFYAKVGIDERWEAKIASSLPLYDIEYSVLGTFSRIGGRTEFHGILQNITQILADVFILNPKPEKMRNYAPITQDLLTDASNLAGVIAQLSEQQLSQFNQTIYSYVKHLPERDIQRVWATPVGELGTDAMLYCEEEWKPGEKIKIDARSMSDGTLRFIAILTALLTRPQGSQLIIEDIDDGLHPSRFDLLLKMLQEIGSQRKIDILVTTHNPAFLDRLSPDMTPFIIVAHRDSETGESRLTPLEEIDNFPKLYASDSIGNLVTKGAIERSAARTQD